VAPFISGIIIHFLFGGLQSAEQAIVQRMGKLPYSQGTGTTV
jgi:hypothetical protein